MSLQVEIRQRKPFVSLEAEAALSIARTAAVLDNELAETLKPYGLTPTQYNVLRILRGSDPEGLCRFEVADRLITPMPDTTRLLDRLEDSKLVRRERDSEDRRQVKTWITEEGRSLLARLDEVLTRLHSEQVGRLGEEKLRVLIDLLVQVRDRR